MEGEILDFKKKPLTTFACLLRKRQQYLSHTHRTGFNKSCFAFYKIKTQNSAEFILVIWAELVLYSHPSTSFLIYTLQDEFGTALSAGMGGGSWTAQCRRGWAGGEERHKQRAAEG